MESLEDKLKQFHASFKNEKDLAGLFEKLAESFLYGGYVSVKDANDIERYRIFIRTVEFYCHCEGNDSNMPKDPIVYHRNGRYIDGEIPYFPLLAFHAHASGIDITFENERLQLRSSVLIRAYEVFDIKKDNFLTFNKESGKFVTCKSVQERVNHQSTYLYDFLNGFTRDSVEWIDSPRQKSKDFKITRRQNVYKYNGEEKTPEKDERMWSFTRTEEIEEK